MSKKKILIIICGQLKFFDKKNCERIIQSLKTYEVNFLLLPWKRNYLHTKYKFSKIYKQIEIKSIKENNFKNVVKRIKFPDTAAKIENIFHAWNAFSQSINIVNSSQKIKLWKPDYILKYRSDILPKSKEFFYIPKKLIFKNILIPDQYHWHGVNDQIFLIPFSISSKFLNFKKFLYSYSKKNSFFSAELIFLRFLKKNNINIVFNNFDYNIMRYKKKNMSTLSKNNNYLKIPLRDKIFIKILKLKYKFRNFYQYLILKKKRNNHQDIIIR